MEESGKREIIKTGNDLANGLIITKMDLFFIERHFEMENQLVQSTAKMILINNAFLYKPIVVALPRQNFEFVKQPAYPNY